MKKTHTLEFCGIKNNVYLRKPHGGELDFRSLQIQKITLTSSVDVSSSFTLACLFCLDFYNKGQEKNNVKVQNT